MTLYPALWLLLLVASSALFGVLVLFAVIEYGAQSTAALLGAGFCLFVSALQSLRNMKGARP